MELLKQRLIGACVLLSLAIIFIPEIFDETSVSVFLAESHAGQTLPYQQALTKHTAQAVSYKVSTATVEESDSEAWSIRVGAFSDLSVAEHLTQKLRQHGYMAYMQSSDGNLHHVLVGPEWVVSNAEEVQQRLAEHLNLNGVVVPYEPILYVQSYTIQQG